MMIHNLKVSIRNFKRHKTSFFINLLGLIGGLITTFFIYIWVDHELSVDKFHEDGDRIFRLVNDNAGSETLLNSSPIFTKRLAGAIPEIELLVNSSWSSLESSLIVNDEVFSSVGEFGSEGFFELFSYPFLSGTGETVLDKPNAIVLSESMALKLFKTSDVVGETLEWRWYNSAADVVVTGVFKDLPAISSEQFDYVLSFDIFERKYKERIERGSRLGRTYLKLSESAQVEEVNKKISEFVYANYPDFTLRPAFLISYSHYYLYDHYENGQPVGGRMSLVQLFVVIGALILIIACVNFMNLSTARATLRTKEIGVRKVMGAGRNSLIQQYLIESCLLSLFAGLIAVLLLLLLFPFFEQVTGQASSIHFTSGLVMAFVGIVLITGLLSGSYPAFYLSGFQPLSVLKGLFISTKKDQWFRKGLVVFQFSISLILISSVLVIYQQMQFIQSKNLGYSDDHILNFRTNNMNRERQQAFLSEARRIQGVEKASGITHALFGGQIAGSNINWQGKDPEKVIWFEWGYADYDMLELLEIDAIQGRFFSKEYGNERSKVVINEATKRLIGLENPVGEKLSVGETDYEIIGVAENFHFQSLHEQIKPTFFRLSSGYSMKLALKIKSENLTETVDEITDLYAEFNPGFPFEYSFHDQEKHEMYLSEQKVTVLSKYAAGLAVFISCLGLLALVSFVAERKTKEMGVRKVLGASSRSLISILSKDFMSPILFASVLGVFVSAYAMEYWLNSFAYRIDLEWWFFCFFRSTNDSDRPSYLR